MSVRRQSLRGHGKRVRSRKYRQAVVDTGKTTVRKRSSRASSRSGLSTSQFFLTQAIAFLFVFGTVYGFSILMGSSLMENARRDKVRAVSRMKVAREDMTRLRNRMDRVTTMTAIDTWARTRGFVPPHGLTEKTQGDSLVAQNN